jgi:hypothetical protein
MAAGDVTVQLVENVTTTTLDTAITAIRSSVGANGKILMEAVNNGLDMFVVGIEEA